MKIAFITSRFPFPLEKGDKLRAFHQIVHLSKRHDLHLFAINDRSVREADRRELLKHCRSVEVFVIPFWRRILLMIRAFVSGEPLQVGFFYSPAIRDHLHDHLLELNPDHIFCQLVRAAPYVASLPVEKTLDYMDVFSEGMKQRAKRANFLLSPFFSWEAGKLSEFERLMYREFDHQTIISKQDRDRLPLTYRENVMILPNGVDSAYFSPVRKGTRYEILFVGNMGYLPNVEAVEYLIREIMPVVWKALPECKVCVAGARPSQRVRILADSRVTITGWVEDIREAYMDARIFVAPIFSGIGQQNKILEAMAMGLPCITSDLVNNAIGAEHREHILIANDATEFSKIVLNLLDDPSFCRRIGEAARKFIAENYSWETQNKKLEKLFYEGTKDKPELLSV